MWKIRHKPIGGKVSPGDYNELVDRLNLMVNVYGRNISGKLTSQGYYINVLRDVSGDDLVRKVVVASNPTATDYVKVTFLTAGIAATSGGGFEQYCFARIANGSRLDMAIPKLAIGQSQRIAKEDYGIDVDINAWDSAVKYMIGEQCSYDSCVYRSIVLDNLNNTPTEGGNDYWAQYTPWHTDEAYAEGTIIEFGDLLYKCITTTTDADAAPPTEKWELLTRTSNPKWYFTDTFNGAENRSYS